MIFMQIYPFNKDLSNTIMVKVLFLCFTISFKLSLFLLKGDFGNPLTQGRVLYGMMADTGDSVDSCDATAIPVIISNVYTVVDWINKYI